MGSLRAPTVAPPPDLPSPRASSQPPAAPHPGAVPASGDARREDADWFRNLPAAGQDEFRARWASEADRRGARVAKRKLSIQEGAVRGLVVFAVVDGIFGSGGGLQHAAAAVVGALLGTAWVRLDLGRFAYVVSGLVAWVAVAVAFGPNTFGGFMILVGMPFHAALCVLAAHVRETRLSDHEES